MGLLSDLLGMSKVPLDQGGYTAYLQQQIGRQIKRLKVTANADGHLVVRVLLTTGRELSATIRTEAEAKQFPGTCYMVYENGGYVGREMASNRHGNCPSCGESLVRFEHEGDIPVTVTNLKNEIHQGAFLSVANCPKCGTKLRISGGNFSATKWDVIESLPTITVHELPDPDW